MDSEQRKVRSKLDKLENEDVQRRLALQRADPDCIRAADWVKNNQRRLKRKVWGPIALEVSDAVVYACRFLRVLANSPMFTSALLIQMKLNEMIHAKYVEDTLPKWLLGALVTECYDDYNTILRELNNGNSDRRIKASILNVEDGRCHAVNRPYSSDKMNDYRDRYGMMGFLDEVSVIMHTCNKNDRLD